MVQKRYTVSSVEGYAPNVSNFLCNLPNAMYNTIKKPQKVKAVNIFYNVTENCCIDSDKFIKSGICVLNLINRFELSGTRVKLKILFCSSSLGKDVALGTVDVKDFHEFLDLQKMCFPIVHPSMLRRFGFKWLETLSGLKEKKWAATYGSKMYNNDIINCLKDKKVISDNDIYIELSTTEKYNYDDNAILSDISSGKYNP